MELVKISELDIKEITTVDAYVPIIDNVGDDIENYRISLLNLFKTGGIINVNRTYGDSNYTLQTALGVIEPTLLVNGVFITFRGIDGWELYQKELDTYIKYLNRVDDELEQGSNNPLSNDAITRMYHELLSSINSISRISHRDVTDKNAEPEFQHITETEKTNFVTTSNFVEALIENATSIAHEELLNIITDNELIPGSSYRITDYTTTTVQTNTQSEGHDFDIIVTALSSNELSEDAKCVRKSGDTYFENANLEAWEIKYCINNDTSRFAWADTVNGKGVIYYMKDEWNNECPYDFKNVQYQTRPGFKYFQWGNNYTFKRDNSLDTIIADVQYYGYVGDSIPMAWSSNTCWLRDNSATTVSVMYDSSGSAINYGGNITAVSNENYDVYTFSTTKTTSEDFDVSLNGLLYSCYNNTIRPYFTNQEHKYQALNRITFVGWNTAQSYPGLYCYGNNFEYDCHDNNFEYDCYDNNFGSNFQSNTFGNVCNSNKFGSNCSSNTFGNAFQSNTFGNYCMSNTFDSNCSNNTFGNNFFSNTFDSNCSNNTFGNSCGSNMFGTNCSNNTFGNNCGINTFGMLYIYNTFGDNCSNNTFGNYCMFNTFGNYCNYNNFYTGTSGTTNKDYIKYIVLEDGCTYNNFYSSITTSSTSYLHRIRIKGLEFTTATNTQITLSATNTKYEWLICYTSAGTLKQYCPND